MDFHSMKRKQLQALCKKHKIPANLSNLDMANRLADFLKEKENPVIHVVMKDKEDSVHEAESNNVIVNRKVKKVRFSPEHELIEFTRVQELKRRSRRNSVCRTDSNCSVEIVASAEVNTERVGRRGRVTRTGELKIVEEDLNRKKRGGKAVECIDVKAIASAVETVDDDKLEEVDVVESCRVTRSRGKMGAQGVKRTSTREKKGAKGDDKRDDKASDDGNNEKHVEIVASHIRVTRSRAQKLTEAPVEVGKRGRRVVQNIGKVAAVRAEAVANGESGADSLSKSADEGEGTSATVSDEGIRDNGEGLKDNSLNKQIAGVHVTVEPQVVLRRSKRKANVFGDSEITNSDKHENGGIKDTIEVNPGRRAVQKSEEPIKKVKPRRSNSRKTVVESGDLKAETENRFPLGTSLPPSDVVPEVSKDDKKVLRPIGVLRRSRRKTLSLKLDSANDTDSAVENIEAEKHVSEPYLAVKENCAVKENTMSRSSPKCHLPGIPDKIGGDSNVHQYKEVIKRRRGNASEGGVMQVNNDHICEAQPLKGSSSKKVACAVATEKVAADGKQPRLLDNHNTLDASHSSSEIGEPLFLDVQLPASESASNLCTNNIIIDVEPTSISRKKENVSIADSACMNFRNGEEFANSAASKIGQLGTDCTVSEDQNCISSTREVEKGNSKLVLDAQQSTERSITDVDKNSETQVCSQMEDSVCNAKISDHVLADGLDVSRKEGSDAHSFAGSLLVDPTNVIIDLEVPEIKADEKLQPCTRGVDHHNDFDHLEASNSIPDNNNGDAFQTAGEVGTFVSYETDYTHPTGTSKLKGSSLSMTLHHGDNLPEENETLFHEGVEELAEVDKDGFPNDCRNEFDTLDLCNDETCEGEFSKGYERIYDEVGESSLAKLFDAEGRYGITPQDREKLSGEVREGEFSNGYMSKCDEDGESSLAKLFDAEGRYGITPQDREKFFGEVREGEFSNGHMRKCDEDGEFSLANLFDAAGVHRITPKDRKKSPGETRESECFKGHMSKCDEDGGFSLANLFDAEGRYAITPQDREKFSGEHVVKDLDEREMLHGLTSVAPITTCNSTRDHEADLSAGGGKTYEDKPSELTEADESGCLGSHKCSKDENWEFSVSNLFGGEERTRINPQYPPAVSTVCVNYNEVKSGRESSNSQKTNPSTPSSVSETQDEQQSRLAERNVLVNSNQQLEAWINASELAGNAVCCSESYAEGKICLVTQALISDEDDKEDSAGKKIAAESPSDAKFQELVETEQHTNLQSRPTELGVGEEATHATGRKSWTEIDFDILFGTTSDEDASPRLHDTFCQGSELEMSKSKSNSNNSGKEVEGDSRNECAKPNYRDVVLPDGFNADVYENELEFLFATPVKIMTLSKIEETCSHDRKQDSSVTSIKDFSDKENVATESMSGEKAQFAGYEVEDSLCIGTSLSDNAADGICEMNEVERFSLLSTSTGILSGAGHDGFEVLEDQLVHNTGECLKKTNLVAGEDKEEHAIPPEKSCFHDEATEKNIISLSGTSWDLYDLESCAHMLETLNCRSKDYNKSEGELTHNTEAAVESSDADLQKSDGSENIHLLTSGCDDGIILKDLVVETSSDSEEAKIGNFEKYVADKDHGSYVFGAVSGLPSNSAMPSSLGFLDKGDTNFEARELSDNGGDDTCEKINEDDDIELKNTFKLAPSGKEYDGCEETNFMKEDNEEDVISLGEPCLSDGGTDHVSGLAEENTIILSGSPNNLEKLKGCQDMLVDFALSESSSSRVYHKSEHEMAQSGEAVLELSVVDLLKSKVSKTTHLTDCFEDDNISEATYASVNTYSDSPLAELASLNSFDGQSIDKGTSLHHSDKVSPVHDELTQRQDTDVQDGTKVCDEIAKSSKDTSDELHINSAVVILKTTPHSDNLCVEADKLPYSVKLESAFLEAKEIDTATQDPNTIVASAEHGSSVCGAVSNILSSSETHLHLRGEINGIANLYLETPVLSLSEDGDNENSEKAEENSTAQMAEFSIKELNSEENIEDIKNDDIHTISSSSASGYNEMLKQSDVAGTIKECIDFESSLSMISENSIASLSGDMLAHTCENSALSKHDTAERLANSKGEDITPSVDCLETELVEQEEATLFMEPARVLGNTAISAEVSMKLDSQKKAESETGPSNVLRSTTRKNARTILIHGTPNKHLTMADMKENMQLQKKNIGDVTAARPAARRALQDVQWK